MSQIWEYIKIALKNITSNKGRSILTMLGIIIGISSVIMIISIGAGVKGGINDEMNNMAGGQLYVYTYAQNDDGIMIEMDEEDIEAIKEQVDHVKAVTPAWGLSGTAYARKGEVQASITSGNEGLEYSSNNPVIKGRYFSANDYFSANKVCVLTEAGAKKLFGNTNVVGMTIELNLYGITQEFTIVGIRQDNSSMLGGMVQMNSITVEIPLSVVGSSYGFYVETFNDLLIVSESPEYATQVAKDVVSLLENRHNVRGKDVFFIENFSDYMSTINDVLGYITVFIVMVAAISLLVGGIGVMNIMLVSVTERTREIGIRKALGARTGSILLQFLSESAIITLLGGIIGIILGMAGAYGVCALIGFSAQVELGTVVGATLFSSGVGIFFGIYPARKAARLSPIEALRHE